MVKKQNKIMIYPNDDLDQKIRDVAKECNRSLSNFVCTILMFSIVSISKKYQFRIILNRQNNLYK